MQKSKSCCVCFYQHCHFMCNIWEGKSQAFQMKTYNSRFVARITGRGGVLESHTPPRSLSVGVAFLEPGLFYTVPRFQGLLALVVAGLSPSPFLHFLLDSRRAWAPSHHIGQTNPRSQGTMDPPSDIGANAESNDNPVESGLCSFLVIHERCRPVMYQVSEVKMPGASRAVSRVGQVLGHTCILGKVGGPISTSEHNHYSAWVSRCQAGMRWAQAGPGGLSGDGGGGSPRKPA